MKTKTQWLQKVTASAILGSLLFAPPLWAEEDDFANEPAETAQKSSSSDFEEDDFAEETPASSGSASGGGMEMADLGISFNGFLEWEMGGHIGETSVQRREWIMNNQRFRLKTSKTNAKGGVYLKADFVTDEVTRTSTIDLREARLQYAASSWMDLSLGKQVNTWGVGDMLFINDLFPKNWVANFLGRDMESMKDAANSYRASSYFGNWTLDVVYHPEFAPDTTPTGCRFAVYNPNSMLYSTQSKLVSNTASCGTNSANSQQTGEYSHGETASRLKTNLSGMELALYSYNGYYKNPKGLVLSGGSLSGYYPKLSVLGASAEGQIGPGIFSFEMGRYDSREDQDGTNPLIENSALKTLVGYKMDFSAHLGAGVQWYAEKMEHYDAYETGILNMLQGMGYTSAQAASLDPYRYRREEIQNTYTLRLMFKAQQETLYINLFSYFRPQDRDSFTKIDCSKRVDNNLEVTVGANVFTGNENYSDREFGMLQNDDNAFMRIKYNF